MYPYEHYFKNLKGFFWNLAKPESNISQGFDKEESLAFMKEYMADYTLTSVLGTIIKIFFSRDAVKSATAMVAWGCPWQFRSTRGIL
jgi:hypothetical protein